MHGALAGTQGKATASSVPLLKLHSLNTIDFSMHFFSLLLEIDANLAKVYI